MEVIDTLIESLLLKDTAASVKLARLYALSDILHNTNAPVKNASAYRPGFQARLRGVMASFHHAHKQLAGEKGGFVPAKTLRDKVSWFNASFTPLACPFQRYINPDLIPGCAAPGTMGPVVSLPTGKSMI
jgi:hypothetical protein